MSQTVIIVTTKYFVLMKISSKKAFRMMTVNHLKKLFIKVSFNLAFIEKI